MTGALRACLDAGGPPVRVLRYGGLWGEVDEPSDLAVYARSDLAPLPIPSERDSILRELHG